MNYNVGDIVSLTNNNGLAKIVKVQENNFFDIIKMETTAEFLISECSGEIFERLANKYEILDYKKWYSKNHIELVKNGIKNIVAILNGEKELQKDVLKSVITACNYLEAYTTVGNIKMFLKLKETQSGIVHTCRYSDEVVCELKNVILLQENFVKENLKTLIKK